MKADLERRHLSVATRCGVCSDFGKKCTATVSNAGRSEVNGDYAEAPNILSPTGGACVLIKENCGGNGRVCGIRYVGGRWEITSSRSSNRVAYYSAAASSNNPVDANGLQWNVG